MTCLLFTKETRHITVFVTVYENCKWTTTDYLTHSEIQTKVWLVSSFVALGNTKRVYAPSCLTFSNHKTIQQCVDVSQRAAFLAAAVTQRKKRTLKKIQHVPLTEQIQHVPLSKLNMSHSRENSTCPTQNKFSMSHSEQIQHVPLTEQIQHVPLTANSTCPTHRTRPHDTRTFTCGGFVHYVTWRIGTCEDPFHFATNSFTSNWLCDYIYRQITVIFTLWKHEETRSGTSDDTVTSVLQFETGYGKNNQTTLNLICNR